MNFLGTHPSKQLAARAVIACCIGIFLGAAALHHAPPAQAAGMESLLGRALGGDHRDPANRARDVYRHPAETLTFMGLEPDMTVVEIWPARGWYTEVLAPVLRGEGKLYAAAFDLDGEGPQYRHDVQKSFLAMLEQHPGVYDGVTVTKFGPGSLDIAPAGSADMVLTFRNVHNWIKEDFAPEAFRAFHAALKAGGVLGVVEHRAKPGTSLEQMIESGYVTEDKVIELATEAGFELAARSEVNANPKDTREHEHGVWTLPPSLWNCRPLEGAEKQACEAKYRPIGESDRMTLRFRKPGA